MLVQLKRYRYAGRCTISCWLFLMWRQQLSSNSLPFPSLADSLFFWPFSFIFCVISVWFLLLYLCSQGWQCTHNAFSLWLSLVSPTVKFFGFDPGAAGLPCMSPLGLGLCLGRSLSILGGATFIGWRPRKSARQVTWSGAVTQRRPAGVSVPAVWPAVWSPGSSSVQSVAREGRGFSRVMTRWVSIWKQ